MCTNNNFMQILNSKLPESYQIFKFDKAIDYVKGIQIVLLVEANDYDNKINDEIKNQIESIAKDIIPFESNINVLFKKTASDENFIIGEINKFLYNEDPVYASQIFSENIEIEFEVGGILIKIDTTSDNKTMFLNAEVDKKIVKFLQKKVMPRVRVEFSGTLKSVPIFKNRSKTMSSSADKLVRLISIEQQEKIIGSIVNDPIYISDIDNTDFSIVVVCGLPSKVMQKSYEKENKTRYLTKLVLTDGTGDSVECVRFDIYKSNYDKLTNVLNKEVPIVVSGEIKKEEFNGFNKNVLHIRNVATCTIDYGSIITTIPYKDVSSDYINVFPEEYYDEIQSDFFNSDTGMSDEFLVVFDLETTGLNTTIDKIIEIGAVKMKNRRIIQTFSTLVNPEMPVPNEASSVNNIFDDMLENAPKFGEVIADFHKFCYGCTLVAHNASFDTSFLSFNAKKYSYNFDNDIIDTMALAREKLHSASRGLSLKSLCKKFKIKNENAHRALSDAIATAELYKILIDM